MKIIHNSTPEGHPRFSDVNGIPKILPCLKPAAIRWLIYQDKEFNSKCVFRLGRKVLIGIPELFAFVESRKTK